MRTDRRWRVRLAEHHDYEAVRDLSQMNHAESCPHLEWSEDRARASFFGAYMDRQECLVFVVEDAGQVVGFLLATWGQYRTFAGLFTCQEVMFVRPDKRGTRAAALLMKKLVEWSREMGAIEVLGGNDNGIMSEQTARFLSRFGFRKYGYAMRLDLNGQ